MDFNWLLNSALKAAKQKETEQTNLTKIDTTDSKAFEKELEYQDWLSSKKEQLKKFLSDKDAKNDFENPTEKENEKDK